MCFDIIFTLKSTLKHLKIKYDRDILATVTVESNVIMPNRGFEERMGEESLV